MYYFNNEYAVRHCMRRQAAVLTMFDRWLTICKAEGGSSLHLGLR